MARLLTMKDIAHQRKVIADLRTPDGAAYAVRNASLLADSWGAALDTLCSLLDAASGVVMAAEPPVEYAELAQKYAQMVEHNRHEKTAKDLLDAATSIGMELGEKMLAACDTLADVVEQIED